MGKYERSLKQVQIKNLVAENDLDKALELVEDMMRDKVTDVSDLRMYAEVYYKCGIYDKAKDLYYRVYDELPTRRNLYRLIVVCAKGRYLDEAESLLKEYSEKDSESINKYVLRYRIDVAAGESAEVLIRDLEDIALVGYTEKWAYELIKQYYKAGMTDECIAECRNMITWFSEGELVNKIRKILDHMSEEAGDAEENIAAGEPEPELEPEPEDSLEIPLVTPPAEFFEEPEKQEDAEDADITVADPEEEIATVEFPEETISLDIFDEEENPETESIGEETTFSKFADDIPYIHDSLFFSSADNININRLSFVIAAQNKDDAEKTVQRIAKIVRKIKGGKMRIAKISAEKINSIDFEKEIEKLDGACVLIENASEISSRTINSIIKMMEIYPDNVAIILVDTEEALSRMFFREQILKNQMAHFIYIN